MTNNFLLYLGPPLLGAFIGYMTNYVAIRMLFRPLRPWRLFGIRIPMTPGVIPSKRHDLAKNIGRMVGSQLLTPTDVGRALNRQGFQQELQHLVNARVTTILNRDLGPLPTIIPQRFQSYFDAGVKILLWRALKLLHSHLESEAFSRTLTPIINSNLDQLLSTPINNLVSEPQRQRIFTFIVSTTEDLLAKPEVEQWISNYLDQKIQELLVSKRPLREILPQQLPEVLLQLLRNEAPAILERLGRLLHEPETKEKIIGGITGAINSFIASLGPMAALVSGFISTELIESKINDYLTDKGDAISDWLQNQEMQDKLVDLLQEKLTTFLEQPVSTLLATLELDHLARLRQEMSQQLTGLVQSRQTVNLVAGLLNDALTSQSEKRVSETVTAILGKEGLVAGKSWASGEIISVLRSNNVQRMLDTMITSLVEEKLLERPIVALSQFLPKAV